MFSYSIHSEDKNLKFCKRKNKEKKISKVKLIGFEMIYFHRQSEIKVSMINAI